MKECVEIVGVLLRIHHIYPFKLVLYTDFVGILYLRSRFLPSALGRDQDDAIGRPHPIDGGGSRVFQDRNGLNVVRVNHGHDVDVSTCIIIVFYTGTVFFYRYPVNDIQRRCDSPCVYPADTNSRTGVRVPLVSLDLHPGHLPLHGHFRRQGD